MKDFDPTKVLKVQIDNVEPNSYNPKQKDTPEYRNVVKSIQLNGLKQPIFVREVDDNDNYVIVDGEQRWTAAKELGYKEIYIYNLGKISEEEAKSLTIWLEVSVPFDEADLAPIVMELNDLNIELPYNELEIDGFRNLATFNFEDAWKEQTPLKEDNDKDEEILTIKMTSAQLEIVNNAIEEIKAVEKVKEGEALTMLCERGLNVIHPTES